jgi:hypothetical protein
MTSADGPFEEEDVMSKLSDRERLAELEARQLRAADEVAQARSALRGRYGAAVADYPVENLTERDFREALSPIVRVGGPATLAALKSLPNASITRPAKT